MTAPVLFSCHSNSKAVLNQKPENEKNTAPSVRSDYWLHLQIEYASKRNQGLDFYAMGVNPDWTLEIDEDSLVRFQSGAGMEEFSVSGTEGRQPADYRGTMYFLKNQSSVCNIRILPDSCRISKDESLPYTLSVRLENQNGEVSRFEGCGLYLNDPTLNDIWALKSWSRYPDAQEMPGNPNIQINLGTNRMYGNLGCGDIQGYILPKGYKLKIYRLDRVDQTITCKSAFANELFESLNATTHTVNRKGLDLILSTGGDTLVFRKVD